ncbi:unnamed protein product [Didymodactylos carnosus]|uniref:Phytanoyl-CoA dioxygenase n=1 Tax=Didymodactylos carnosus TaxID=1234261 RepID=A0A815NX65_9BILA|nr:unnamed protein product [Didymodactylos carnosus]CAF1441143.1 unnamed protein product [Didymodactylos carnosus]CAF3978462.1 unnamed protein product [Didymodactylos carnosus]CAF4317327.1 unnamed protein product [Didymodactylos carnosus]
MHLGNLIFPKERSVNKIGHALHVLDPNFKRITFSDKIKTILHDLEYKKPAICQSMYIFKQPYIGAKVGPHQDGTFLFNEPLNIMGVWIALEDATLENGCLSFIPKSHTRNYVTLSYTQTHENNTCFLEPIERRFIRNPNKEEFDNGNLLMFTGPESQPEESEFVLCPIKAGDAILIHGQVVHKSEQNTSPITRQIYTFHVIETNNSTYSKENW